MEEGEVLVPQPRTTAPAFQPSVSEEPRNGVEAIWNICRKKASVKSANTTNVNQRLQTRHPQQHKTISDVQRVVKWSPS